MNEKNNHRKKHPGFYECISHDYLSPILTQKPNTLCRVCFKRINTNLVLHLARTITSTVRLEHFVSAHNNTLQKMLLGMDKFEHQIRELQVKIDQLEEK